MLIRKKAGENSDDSSNDDETALAMIDDRWREEWNRGVQVRVLKIFQATEAFYFLDSRND